jgi:hypothetical protein
MNRSQNDRPQSFSNQHRNTLRQERLVLEGPACKVVAIVKGDHTFKDIQVLETDTSKAKLDRGYRSAFSHGPKNRAKPTLKNRRQKYQLEFKATLEHENIDC